MQTLNKSKSFKKKILIGVYAFLIIGIILIGTTYAVYKQEAEVTFIKARVGKFKANDIELSMRLDGEEVETPPSKDNYTVDISCDNADGSWDSDRWGAIITNITAGKVKCEVNFATPAPTLSEVTATPDKTSISLSYRADGLNINTTCKYGTSEGDYPNSVEEVQNTGCNITGLEMDTTYYYQVCTKNGAGETCKIGSAETRKTIADQVNVGDYIKMTPTSTMYKLPDSLSGCTNASDTCVQKTINPRELNLWRVIRKNSDGTIDMVSNYVSSGTVYFYGKVGYINYILGLNTIASQYTDGVHVFRTRHIGYRYQTERLTDTSALEMTTIPWDMASDSGMREFCNGGLYWCGLTEGKGGGDIDYMADLDLVEAVYGKINAPTKDGVNNGTYLASRYYTVDYGSWGFRVRSIAKNSTISSGHMFGTMFGGGEYRVGGSVRPIVTLRSESAISGGSGTSSSPYSLS